MPAEIIKKIENYLLDILFPISCVICGKGQDWICRECFGRINVLSSQLCPYCEKMSNRGGRFCSGCQESFSKKGFPAPLDALMVATRYKERGISRLIHMYKYNFIADLGGYLGKIICQSYQGSELAIPDMIIPVPLHPRRLRWRGFNQSELLSDHLGRNLAPGLQIPVRTDIIERKKYTVPQMKISSYSERKSNIKDAFSIKNGSEIGRKNILLVDDVATTGSTLFECGRILKHHGAQSVFAAVIARQDMGK